MMKSARPYLGISCPKVCFWPIFATGVLNLSVRLVPEAEVNPGILNVGYGESRRSDFIAQLPLSTLTGPLHNTAGIGWIEFSQMINQR